MTTPPPFPKRPTDPDRRVPHPGLQQLAEDMPLLMKALETTITNIVGSGEHNLIMVIGHLGVSQYVANIPRDEGKRILLDLFARWELNMEDLLPAQLVARDTGAFEYLLKQYDDAVLDVDGQADQAPFRRGELITFVSRLLRK